MTRRRFLSFAPTLLLALCWSAPALALESKLIGMRVAGGSLFAELELRDLFPQKFQSVLENRAAIYMRVQIELWENRPVWDKLAQPAVVAVFRMVLDPQTRQVRVSDQYGEVSRQPAWQEPLALRLDLGRADSLADGAKYYVRALATLGTLAEKETATATKAVFGDDDSTVSVAAMGKVLFRAVLQVNEYLQSESSEIRSREMTGRELKAGVKF
jgi:hypothetical protein